MTGRGHLYYFQYLQSTWNRMVGKYGFSPHYWYRRKVLVYKSHGKTVRKVKRYKRTHRKKGQPMNPRSIRDQAALTARVWKNETSKEWDPKCRLELN